MDFKVYSKFEENEDHVNFDADDKDITLKLKLLI